MEGFSWLLTAYAYAWLLGSKGCPNGFGRRSGLLPPSTRCSHIVLWSPGAAVQLELEYKLGLMNKQSYVRLGLSHVSDRKYSPGIHITTVGAVCR